MSICHFGQTMNTLEGVMSVVKPDKAIVDEEGHCYMRQKPVALYTSLIEAYVQPHSWVMDLCSGAGTLLYIFFTSRAFNHELP